ncbi:MAG: rhodanese-like domain-containing protein [Bacteroidia bacterium]
MGILDSLFGPKVDLSAIKKQGAIILDVRSTGEYQSGHGIDSINIPLDQIHSKIDKLKGYNKPILTCCASGMRSGSAASILKNHGIEAYNAGSWSSADRL